MLILTRKQAESIMLGDTIEIHVKEIKGHYVRLGITAPADTPVFRKEVWLRKQQEGKPKGRFIGKFFRKEEE